MTTSLVTLVTQQLTKVKCVLHFDNNFTRIRC